MWPGLEAGGGGGGADRKWWDRGGRKGLRAGARWDSAARALAGLAGAVSDRGRGGGPGTCTTVAQGPGVRFAGMWLDFLGLHALDWHPHLHPGRGIPAPAHLLTNCSLLSLLRNCTPLLPP